MDGASEFEVGTERVGRAIVVSCTGELDLHTVPELTARLDGVVGGGARRVLVDLSGVTFVDSTALGALLAARRRLGSLFGSLALVCADPAVLRAFEVTGLDRLFAIHPRREDALAETVAEPRDAPSAEALESLLADLDRAREEHVAGVVHGDA